MGPVFIAVYLAVIIHAPLAAVLSLNHYSQMRHDSASRLMINKPTPSASPRPRASFAIISSSSECGFSPAQAAGGGGGCSSRFKETFRRRLVFSLQLKQSQLTLHKCTNCSSVTSLFVQELLYNTKDFTLEPGLKELSKFSLLDYLRKKICFSGQN